MIAENGLSPCVEVRAVDNERDRTKALILRERPDPITQPGRMTSGMDIPMPSEGASVPPTAEAAFPSSATGVKEETRMVPAPLPAGAPLPVEPAFTPDTAKPAPLPSSVTEAPATNNAPPPLPIGNDPGLRTPPPQVDPFSETELPFPQIVPGGAPTSPPEITVPSVVPQPVAPPPLP